MGIDHISLSTTPVFLFKGDKALSQGTGFFYLHEHTDLDLTILYLVTNYHVLTGSRPLENKPPYGDTITCQFHRSEEAPGDIKTVQIPLFTEKGKHIWITSSSCPEADFAVIPLINSLYKGCDIKAISPEWEKGDVKVRPTTNVTLVGYPKGFYDKTNALPVWQTGSVASEPEIDFDGKPLFLIDVPPLSGMSGAPVFAISSGTYQMETDGSITEGDRKFLGVYASMETTDKREHSAKESQDKEDKKLGFVESESLKIGHVWKASLITQTIVSIDFDQYNTEVLVNLM